MEEQYKRFVKDPANNKQPRIRIAKFHFPSLLVMEKHGWATPLTKEEMDRIGCYKNRSPPPQNDALMKYNPELGTGQTKSANKKYKGESLFRVAPCAELNEVTHIAGTVQNGGGRNRIDMGGVLQSYEE